jgi:GNAT superfamily N-acetyltransferase
MRPRSDAGDSRLLNDIRLDEVTRPEDPRLDDLVQLLDRTFPDPNSVLGLDRIQQFLRDNAADSARQFYILVAEKVDGSGLVGASIFSYVAGSNCGFSEYLVVDASLRRRGLGRALFNARQAILHADATDQACHGLFIEVDSPWRTPAGLLEAGGIHPLDRLRVFRHLGFRRVAVAYVQPPLAPDKQAVDHMDLLFAPWRSDSSVETIPSEWLFHTLETIWSRWTPGQFGPYLDDLRNQVTGSCVSLVNPLEPH